jgi:hypothetical protein
MERRTEFDAPVAAPGKCPSRLVRKRFTVKERYGNMDSGGGCYMSSYLSVLFFLSILALGIYVFTGNQWLPDNILLFLIIVGFPATFLIVMFGAKNRMHTFYKWGSGVIVMGIALYFITMSLLWNQP